MLVACTAQEKEETINTKETKKTTQTVKPKERSGEELFEKACHSCHNYRLAIPKYGIPQWKNKNMVKFIEEAKDGKHNWTRRGDGGYRIGRKMSDITQKEMQNIAEFIHKLNSGEAKMKPLPKVKPRKLPERVYMIVNRILQPLNTTTQEYKDFKKQENRLVLNPCVMSYNEEPIRFGMNIEELRKILGKESSFDYQYYWDDKGLEIGMTKGKLSSINVYLKTYERWSSDKEKPKHISTGQKSFIVFNSVLKQTDKMHEFLDKTNFYFDDFKFGHDTWWYGIHLKCAGKRISYAFKSKPSYDIRNYGGHLSVIGNFMPTKTRIVKSVSISIEQEK